MRQLRRQHWVRQRQEQQHWQQPPGPIHQQLSQRRQHGLRPEYPQWIWASQERHLRGPQQPPGRQEQHRQQILQRQQRGQQREYRLCFSVLACRQPEPRGRPVQGLPLQAQE